MYVRCEEAREQPCQFGFLFTEGMKVKHKEEQNVYFPWVCLPFIYATATLKMEILVMV